VQACNNVVNALVLCNNPYSNDEACVCVVGRCVVLLSTAAERTTCRVRDCDITAGERQ